MTCAHHGADACCTECPDHAATDGRGFPHPREAKGREALQRCPYCRYWVLAAEWTNDIPLALFGCKTCVECAREERRAPIEDRRTRAHQTE